MKVPVAPAPATAEKIAPHDTDAAPGPPPQMEKWTPAHFSRGKTAEETFHKWLQCLPGM